jgi:1,4-alpha-glucan branching enzyme
MVTTQVMAIQEHDPHHMLGLHNGVIRLWRPGAAVVHLEVRGKVVEAKKVGEGLFEYAAEVGPRDYRVYHTDGMLAHDPYAFLPQVGEMDLFLFNAGRHYEVSSLLGANFRVVDGVAGVVFAVWAPNARAVHLVADFNHWDGRVNPMRSMGVSGIWELFVPGVKEGTHYKFEIRTKEGGLKIKSDPFATFSESRPKNASVVFDVNRYQWKDAGWKRGGVNQPICVYEVHLGSWKKIGGYREIAVELAKYCLEMGFTHVELLPVMEHPLDESWGYQVTGFYAVTARFGTPEDFQFFVDHMHQKGIGVILDWVPAHFPTDAFSLSQFDGTALYEHADPKRGLHPHWNTAIFNYGRHEVVNFLIGSALFWIEKMHIDGLRVDAVASMLYLDYGRLPGEWIPNPDGSNFDVEAIEFMKHLNSIVHQRNPNVLMIAEESTAFMGVTAKEGLGFDLKWNMGWMNDTLRYISRDPIYRRYHQNDLTFCLLYAFSERFILVLSHDEVVHMKASLLSKMPGDDWQKFANMRLLYSYQIGHPGKKLLFMGGEVGQWREWDCKGEIDWYLLQYSPHRGLSDCVKDLNLLYQARESLWKHDFSWEGFQWIDFSDSAHCVISYLRKDIVFVHNFTPEYRETYWIPLKKGKKVREILNTDDLKYGGSGKVNPEVSATPDGFAISLSPLATMIFEVTFEP